jgi:hypothetical protein
MGNKILLVAVLAIGFTGLGLGIMACTRTERTAGSDQTCPEPFSMVVSMGGKELTLGPPTVSPAPTASSVVTVVVKNSGAQSIASAEIEITYLYEVYQWVEQVEVKDLSPGEVQTLIFDVSSVDTGTLEIKVLKIE